MQAWPQRTAVRLGLVAFLVTLATAWAAEVPPVHAVWRALAAAGVFGVIGLFVGRAALNLVCDSLAEQMQRERAAASARTTARTPVERMQHERAR